MSQRQKLIKLADRSECGWATVSVYVTDDLADSPEDERRISTAENRQRRPLTLKERNPGINRVLLITNVIMPLTIFVGSICFNR